MPYRNEPFQTEEPYCPACKEAMILKTGKYGRFWGCPNYPDCTYNVGAHPDGRPLGIPGDKETRQLRSKLHDWFAQYYNWDNSDDRHAMYAFLKMHTRSGHIGMMDKVEIVELLDKISTGRLKILNPKERKFHAKQLQRR